MTVQVSTKFKELILGPHAFTSIFDKGAIRVYSGSQPASADAAVTGTLLGTITAHGLPWQHGSPDNGLSFIQAGPFVVSDASIPMVFTGIAAGTAGWYRLVANPYDSGDASFSHARIDGTVSTGITGEMRFSNAIISPGLTIIFNQFLYTIPPVIGV